MDDAAAVRLLERLGDVPRDLEGLAHGDGPALEALPEVLAADEHEGEEGRPVDFLQTVDRGDARMVEGGQQMGLAPEAGEALGVLRPPREGS